MKLNEYQSQARKFAKHKVAEHPFFALMEEAGEVYIRASGLCCSAAIGDCWEAKYGVRELKEGLVKELGDVLWQLSACCNELDINLEYVARRNLEKLSGRDKRGTIVGEGDDR